VHPLARTNVTRVTISEAGLILRDWAGADIDSGQMSLSVEDGRHDLLVTGAADLCLIQGMGRDGTVALVKIWGNP
jgi:hypothetical protein